MRNPKSIWHGCFALSMCSDQFTKVINKFLLAILTHYIFILGISQNEYDLPHGLTVDVLTLAKVTGR